jgi:hypothetical protein
MQLDGEEKQNSLPKEEQILSLDARSQGYVGICLMKMLMGLEMTPEDQVRLREVLELETPEEIFQMIPEE